MPLASRLISVVVGSMLLDSVSRSGKVWHNTLALQEARRAGPQPYAIRFGELEVLSAARIADLLAPGPVLLRLAVAGFGVVLPPPA
jgi:hypothetical protein